MGAKIGEAGERQGIGSLIHETAGRTPVSCRHPAPKMRLQSTRFQTVPDHQIWPWRSTRTRTLHGPNCAVFDVVRARPAPKTGRGRAPDCGPNLKHSGSDYYDQKSPAGERVSASSDTLSTAPREQPDNRSPEGWPRAETRRPGPHGKCRFSGESGALGRHVNHAPTRLKQPSFGHRKSTEIGRLPREKRARPSIRNRCFTGIENDG